jgi:exopolysaccharide biosynthesis polyprenyl glycosylphosphotransferase
MKFRRISVIYALLDFLASAGAWTLFTLLRNNLASNGLSYSLFSVEYFTGLLIIPICWVIVFLVSGFYVFSLKRSRLAELSYSLIITITGVIIQFFILLFNGFITVNSLYLYFLEYLFVFQFVLTYIPRVIITSSTAAKVHKGLIGYNTLIIGSNGKALEIYNRIKNEKIPGGNIIVGFSSVTEKINSLLKEQIPYLGQIDKLPLIISENKIEEVIIAIEGNEFDTVEEIIRFLDYRDVTIKAIPSLKDILTGRVKQSDIFGTPLLEISNQLMPLWQANIKQLMDYFLACFFLIILTPFMLILAIIIRVSGKGPVIYSQERIGKNGKPFTILKFRSMRSDAEKENPLLSSKNDQRITVIGQFMRRHRIDEIPNLINVVRGEMSLVGPRPERQYFIDQIVKKAPHYRRLHKVKPGITSWGQVKYGYASDVDSMIERLEYDLLYLENMSLIIDLKIIIYTAIIILKGKGV